MVSESGTVLTHNYGDAGHTALVSAHTLPTAASDDVIWKVTVHRHTACLVSASLRTLRRRPTATPTTRRTSSATTTRTSGQVARHVAALAGKVGRRATLRFFASMPFRAF